MSRILKKFTALIVVITFFWLIQLSAMPLQATTTEASNQEQNPGIVEKAVEVGGGGAEVSKGSILPYVLIGLGVAAVAALLIFVVFKSSYDITGDWEMEDSLHPSAPAVTITFTGDKKSGTLKLVGYIDVGTYTVNGKTVHFENHASGYNYSFVYDGEFKNKNRIEGTLVYKVNNVTQSTGTFFMDRAAAAATNVGTIQQTKKNRSLETK